MNASSAWLAYWARRIGWPVLAGIALVMAAVLFHVMVAISADRRLHALESGVTRMHAAAALREKAWVAESPRASIRAFYLSLPTEQEIPGLLESLFDAAYETNLAPQNGEFGLDREHNAAFSRYRIVLPVQGSYPNIRAFANRVLEEMPFATLDNIAFSRENARTPDVDATLQFTLYLGVTR